MELKLNEGQLRASSLLSKFLDSSNIHKYLLSGPAGSGKTTVIVNAFNGRNLNVAFCAFTNKATQVLYKISSKFSIDFNPVFMTIHKLLMLEPKHKDHERELAFDFDKTKMSMLSKYDVIIFDECSTISKELYGYILEMQEYVKFTNSKNIKLVFLGDFWQLPPVCEEKSVVFTKAVEEKWPLSKLDKVMRSANDEMKAINTQLLSWVPKFKSGDVGDFVTTYPYNLVNKSLKLYLPIMDFYKQFLDTWKTETPDCVMLTYSRNNCEKINNDIQDLLDKEAKRDPPDEIRKNIKFYSGDRCCVQHPVELSTIVHFTKNDKKMYKLQEATPVTLYNGEIFEVMFAEDVLIYTSLNKFEEIGPYFEGQKLTVYRCNDVSEKYEILHIPEPTLNKARQELRRIVSKKTYITIMSEFIKLYPELTYGYCLTVYKSQGSEWHTVLVNVHNIKWSIAGDGKDMTTKKKASLFKATYTALSRASDKLYCYWRS